MGIETAQCKCESGGPGQRADPLDIIPCDVGRTLPLAHAQPAEVGRRRGASVPRGARYCLAQASRATAPAVDYAAPCRLPCQFPAAPRRLRATPAFCRRGRFVTATATGACGSPRENDFNVEC
jgi:hypothetical protein